MGKSSVEQLVIGWPWPYQLGLVGLVALTLCYIVFAEHRAQQLRRGQPSIEETWTESPIVTQYRVLQRREIVRAGAGYDDVYQMRLMRDGHQLAMVTVVRLYEGSFWRIGKSDDLYVTQTQKAPIQATIRSERFRQLLGRVAEVLCVGLASSKGNDRAGGEQLSKNRADRLCDILRATGGFEHVVLRAVPFGQALGPEPADPLEEQAQRAAVIIGLDRQDRSISDEVVFDELLRRVQLNTVDLNNYSRVSALRSGGIGQ